MDKAELRKAAIVLASLDLSAATEVCKRMSEVEAETLIAQVSDLGAVSPEEQEEALAAFRESLDNRTSVDGADRAESLMSAVLGRRTNEPQDDGYQLALQRLRGLNSLPATAIHRGLDGETPQMVAVVLGQLSAEKAAQVVQGYPDDQRADLALRVARLGQLAPGVVEAIGELLGGQAWRGDDEDTGDVGVTFVVNLLEDMDRESSRGLLEQLRGRDEALAEEVEERLFTFESIGQLPDEVLQVLLRSVDNADIARALKGAEQAIMERIMANLSSRGREMLEQEMELTGPVLVKDVEAAQRQVVKTALDLEQAGEITLSTEEQAYVQ